MKIKHRIAELDLMVEGSMPRRVKALVIEWAIDHQQALLKDWQLAEQHQPLNKIEPLE